MQSMMREVLQQTAKVRRIVNRISLKHPELAQDLDIAFYAITKIESIMKRNTTPNKVEQQYKQKQSGSKGLFVKATEQLNKFNVQVDLLFQNVSSIQKIAQKQRSFSKKYEESHWKKSATLEQSGSSAKPKREKGRVEPLRTEPYNEEGKHINYWRDDSADLSQLDANILQLADRIAECVRQDESLEY